MDGNEDRTLLYALIAAGQQAHRALLRPLVERGLEAGDDAVLFLAGGPDGVTEHELSAATGQSLRALLPRLDRLVQRGLMVRKAIGPELHPGYALTEAGGRVRTVIGQHWTRLEATLADGLDRKDRKRLRKLLWEFGDGE